LQNSASDPWFVAQLQPHGLSRAIPHLERQGFRTFAPYAPATRLHRGKRSDTRAPLFPGYLFVGFDPARPGWNAINNTRGVSRLISLDPRKPSFVPAGFMAALMERCDEDALLLPPADLEVGDRGRRYAPPCRESRSTG
jgi:transcriptional antiterminator RfaH